MHNIRKIQGKYFFLIILLFAGCASTEKHNFDRAVRFYHRGDFDRAISGFNLTLKKDPQNVDAYLFRGNSWAEKKETGNALNDYNKAIEINPQNANAYYFRGVLMMEKGALNKAFDDFNKAIQIKPDFVQALVNRAFIWNKRGEKDKAIEDYTNVLSIKPNDEKCYISRGDVWLDKSEFDKAINDYTKAININSTNYKAYFWRQEASTRKGDYFNAIKDLKTVIKINPTYAPAYNNYAWILATCREDKYRDGKRAIELARKASKIKPQYCYWDTLAAAYAETGNYEEAVKAQRIAIKKLEEAGDLNAISKLKERLNRYLSKKPWRE